MNVLLAFRRLVTPFDSENTPAYYQNVIAVRSYGCFNGFNFSGAFLRHGYEGDAFFPSTIDGATRLDTVSGWYESNADMEQSCSRNCTVGSWETVGIGWLYSHATTGTAPLFPTSPNIPTRFDFQIGNALRSEGFQRTYYDAYNGRLLQSKRQLTPNESYLSNLFSRHNTEVNLQVHASATARSMFAYALSRNLQGAGCLYQFVGSERPSGQAISYLQTYRNVSEQQWTGWTDSSGFTLVVLKKVLSLLRPTESPMAIFDLLKNYGTDSAIVAYAGSGFMAHITKYGFWEGTAEFYRDSTSMMTEGRYNKGSQSESIRSNFLRIVSRRLGPSVFQEASNSLIRGSICVFEAVRAGSVGSSLPNMNPFSNQERIMTIAAQGSSSVATFIEQFRTAVEAYVRRNPNADIRTMLEVVRALPDTRRPPEPTPQAATPTATTAPTRPTTQPASESATPRNTTAGAALGFVQWTSQAIH